MTLQTTPTYTIGRVYPATGTGISQLPALFNDTWLSDEQPNVTRYNTIR